MGNKINEKVFFVSKSDQSKKAFIDSYLNQHKVANIFVICENDRSHVFEGMDNVVVLGFKKLNESSNWIKFNQELCENSLLIVDNIVRFIFFGDGKKKYLKHLSQSIGKMIVMDVVPFYEDVSQLYYPFFFLDKDILGYNSYASFKGNHFEELPDGTYDEALSFNVLYRKIEPYYIQDYERFFKDKKTVWWEMNTQESESYQEEKALCTESMDNPIAIFNQMSTKINLALSKFKALDQLTKGNKRWNVVINAGGRFPKMIKEHLSNSNVCFHSYHAKDLSVFSELDNLIFLECPIVKTYKLFYVEAVLKESADCYLFRIDNNLDHYFHNRVINNEVRNQFDGFFGTKK